MYFFELPRITRLPRYFALLAALAVSSSYSLTISAGDWPQILGPHRNGHAVDETLPEKWPVKGPAVKWTYPLGEGYAGPAVVGDRVVVFHRTDGHERIEAVSLATGKRLWKTDFPASYRGGINPDNGPRCVPVIHDGAVYAFGAAGDLHSVDLKTGAKRWSRATYVDYKAPDGYFGAGSTPVVVGEKLLVNVGGRDGAGLVAFALKNGETLWKVTDEGASYSSPTAVKLDGKQRAIFVTRLNCVMIDPAGGDVIFKLPFGQRGPTVNGATPLVIGDKLFLTSSYGVGARLVDLKSGDAKVLWRGDDILSSQYNTPVYHDGHLYGIHGREDIGMAELRCIEAKTGRVKWKHEDLGVAHLILAGDKLLIVKTSGEVVMAKASPSGFTRLGLAEMFDGTVRAIPALSQGKLLARDVDELKCIDVAAK